MMSFFLTSQMSQLCQRWADQKTPPLDLERPLWMPHNGANFKRTPLSERTDDRKVVSDSGVFARDVRDGFLGGEDPFGVPPSL